jgi:hypothetical protein
VPNNPETCADVLEMLVRDNYRAAIAMGARGKTTAREIFSSSRFQQEWSLLLNGINK